MFNSITVTCNNSNLILYAEEFDFRQTSGYYSIINPSHFGNSRAGERLINIDDNVHRIPLSNLRPLGSINSNIEMQLASDRKYLNDISLLVENGYVLTFKNGDRKRAIDSIRGIVSKNLLWDLQEIWIVDPYLLPKDLSETVFHCRKSNVKINALTSYGTIKDNEETSMEIHNADFEEFKLDMKSNIEKILGTKTDIDLEYRSKFNEHGFKFHDRYIMLIYDVNRTRVWSIGTSINQVGNTHHTIQIVNNPDIIEATIRELWEETNHEECVIYKTIKPYN